MAVPRFLMLLIGIIIVIGGSAAAGIYFYTPAHVTERAAHAP